MQSFHSIGKTKPIISKFPLFFTRQLSNINNPAVCNKFMKVLVVSKRNLIYEPDPKGKDFPYKNKIKLKELYTKEYWKDSLNILKQEIGKWKEEVKEHFRGDPIMDYRHNEVDIWWRFRTEEDFDKWIVTSDNDLNVGRSKANLTVSPQGYGLFSGVLSTDVPQDGQIKRTGFANLGTVKATKSFARDTQWNWDFYTHLVIRCRGDGRSYMINLHLNNTVDIWWFDIYHFILFTRGGPYWQTSKIPLSKFFLGNKGRIQDSQFQPPLDKINRLSFTIGEGNIGGPFSLEIQYIGLTNDAMHDEKTAYEMYKVPLNMIAH